MWFSKRDDPRVRDEIRFHRDRLIEDYIAAGMDRAQAERRAFLEFGNPSAIEEEVRDVRGRWLDDLATDLRYTFRMLRRNPGFSAIAVLSLALGIGANAGIFTLVNAVMLRTLPVSKPHRLVQITRINDEGLPGFVSYPLFEYFRDNVQSISGAFAQRTAGPAIVMDGETEFVRADLVSGAYYTVLGLAPAAGRLLDPADETPSSTAAVISDDYWQRRFGRSPSAVGKSFTIGDRVFTIVGVTPASFRGARVGTTADVTLPLLPLLDEQQRRSLGFNTFNLLARLKPGATIAQANAEVQVLFPSILQVQAARESEKDRPAILRQRAMALAAPDGFNPMRDNVARPLLILMGIVGMVLMLACVNLSGLLLARAAARQREISIRLAIGAGRLRLVRQFLTESFVLAAIGGAIGLLIADWLSTRLFMLFVAGRTNSLQVDVDARVLVFTLAVSVLASVVAGLVPALQAVRVNLNPALKEMGAHGTRRLGKALVVAQLAISMVLVIGATLFIGTLVKLYAVDRGFDTAGVLIVQLRSGRPYAPPRALVIQNGVLERLRTLPGVRSASAAQMLPVGGSLWDRRVQVEGYAFRPDESEYVAFNAIAPDYFATLETPVLSGREFDPRDTDAAPRVAVVTESFARYFFGNQSALGRRVTSVNVSYEIIGVVADAKYQSLREGVVKTMYIPWTQREVLQPGNYSYLIRVAGSDPLRLLPSLDRAIREVDSQLRFGMAFTYDTLVERSIAPERIMATLGGLFGLLALVIAAVGVFGVLAFQVARRTNELGVRMALGATRGSMMRMVLREVVWLVVAGVVIGGGVALTLTGLAQSILFGLTPTDPVVFVVAGSILTLAALVAGWLPARRASRVDPLIALRHE